MCLEVRIILNACKYFRKLIETLKLFRNIIHRIRELFCLAPLVTSHNSGFESVLLQHHCTEGILDSKSKIPKIRSRFWSLESLGWRIIRILKIGLEDLNASSNDSRVEVVILQCEPNLMSHVTYAMQVSGTEDYE